MKTEVKSQYIIFRVTPSEKARKVKEAGGAKRLSRYIRKQLGLDK